MLARVGLCPYTRSAIRSKAALCQFFYIVGVTQRHMQTIYWPYLAHSAKLAAKEQHRLLHRCHMAYVYHLPSCEAGELRSSNMVIKCASETLRSADVMESMCLNTQVLAAEWYLTQHLPSCLSPSSSHHACQQINWPSNIQLLQTFDTLTSMHHVLQQQYSEYRGFGCDFLNTQPQ